MAHLFAFFKLFHLSLTVFFNQWFPLRDETSFLDSFSVFFCQNLLRMVAYINFCLFSPAPSTACSLFTLSVKNQARLTRTIEGSYSPVFIVSKVHTLFSKSCKTFS